MNIWNKIHQQIQQNNSIYLLTVIESTGSAPGRRGFKMMVAENELLYGSIGGGIMEFNLVEQAKELLKNNSNSSLLVKQVHRGDAQSSNSGMICSGSQTIVLTPLSKKDAVVIASCIESQQMIEITQKGMGLINIESVEVCDIQSDIQSEKHWRFTELLHQKPVAHIFGAGHVSVPTSELLTQVGFDVMLYDNRENINTFNENNKVLSKQLVSYDNILDELNINAKDYVLLMTHKFVEDKLLLSQLLDKELKYFGVLGSQNKINVMFTALLNEGFKQTVLDKVHAPIGLDINSQTTQEIAVSIVAEVIKVKDS